MKTIGPNLKDELNFTLRPATNTAPLPCSRTKTATALLRVQCREVMKKVINIIIYSNSTSGTSLEEVNNLRYN